MIFFKRLLAFKLNKCVTNGNLNAVLKLNKLYFSSKNNADPLEKLFISSKVQELLLRITSCDVNKVFRPKTVTNMESPKYKLVTDEQLKEMQEDSNKRAIKFLQMPPYKKPWDITNTEELIISNDPEIANFESDDSSYVFTDISPGIHKRDRMVVIRDKKGLLRRCNREESDLILSLYYPQPGKMYNMPQMFQDQLLEKLLGQHQYEYILNRACVQFEPDDPNFIRVTGKTYEHILTTKKFDDLRSTRFFGSMAFYYLIHNKIDQLLFYLLSGDSLDDAFSLVQLYHIVHPTSKCAIFSKENPSQNNFEFIQTYINLDATDKVLLEAMLEVHMRTYDKQNNSN